MVGIMFCLKTSFPSSDERIFKIGQDLTKFSLQFGCTFLTHNVFPSIF